MVFHSLTDIPRNLKEGIDWLMAIKGTDSIDALGAAVHKFLSGKSAGLTTVPTLENIKLISMGFMWRKELRDLWPASHLLGKFIDTVENKSGNLAITMGSNPDAVAQKLGKVADGCAKFLGDIKHPEQYKSAYCSKSTWAKSCSKNPEDCAAIFVGIAPMLFVGLESLRDASKGESCLFGSDDVTKHRLRTVLKAMGYRKRRLRPNMGGYDVRKALSNVQKDVLSILDDISGFDVSSESELQGKLKGSSTTNNSPYWPIL
ncbi:hypothetical protein, conserved [Babesia ovata]|uniref:Uncharacterized protein n=1 Tax=Babesia ovata TaxID=189622 RepID=A0A2H6KCP7_9APIC|nr:uncharacterized protein BOVATA_022690 [Babesia ovata]GBE60776.1 hypothetical protein, conserved [Babesia ovata]